MLLDVREESVHEGVIVDDPGSPLHKTELARPYTPAPINDVVFRMVRLNVFVSLLLLFLSDLVVLLENCLKILQPTLMPRCRILRLTKHIIIIALISEVI